MEKGQNRSIKGKKDNKGCVDSPGDVNSEEYYSEDSLQAHMFDIHELEE